MASQVSKILLLFKFGQIPFQSMGVKKYNQIKLAQKFMQVGIDVMCMYTSFGGCSLSGFGDMATFQKRPNFPFGPWSSKNLIDRNRLKKFMQVGIDVKCMHTNFVRCGFSGFRDMATFQKRPNFPFGAWTIVHGHRKL